MFPIRMSLDFKLILNLKIMIVDHLIMPPKLLIRLLHIRLTIQSNRLLPTPEKGCRRLESSMSKCFLN